MCTYIEWQKKCTKCRTFPDNIGKADIIAGLFLLHFLKKDKMGSLPRGCFSSDMVDKMVIGLFKLKATISCLGNNSLFYTKDSNLTYHTKWLNDDVRPSISKILDNKKYKTELKSSFEIPPDKFKKLRDQPPEITYSGRILTKVNIKELKFDIIKSIISLGENDNELLQQLKTKMGEQQSNNTNNSNMEVLKLEIIKHITSLEITDSNLYWLKEIEEEVEKVKKQKKNK
jgi:hypothetical protein